MNGNMSEGQTGMRTLFCSTEILIAMVKEILQNREGRQDTLCQSIAMYCLFGTDYEGVNSVREIPE